MIFMENFLRKFLPPEQTGGLEWRFKSKSGLEFIRLSHNVKTRSFFGVENYLHRSGRAKRRTLSARDVVKLKRLLPSTAIAECTRASLGVRS